MSKALEAKLLGDKEIPSANGVYHAMYTRTHRSTYSVVGAAVDVNEHARNIGGLLSSLQTIEFQIRAHLAWARFPEATGMPQGHKLADFHIGNEYVAGAFTSYDALPALIEKFNEMAVKRGHKILDCGLIELRDALAHGRCATDTGDNYFRLIKFSKAKAGRVTVVYNAVMDSAWYARQRRMLTDALWVLEDARQQP